MHLFQLGIKMKGACKRARFPMQFTYGAQVQVHYHPVMSCSLREGSKGNEGLEIWETICPRFALDFPIRLFSALLHHSGRTAQGALFTGSAFGSLRYFNNTGGERDGDGRKK